MNIAVFASGTGSNLGAILAHIRRGTLTDTRVALVISNRSGAGALALARQQGITGSHISSRTHPEPDLLAAALLAALRHHSVELVVLAGYLRLLPPRVIAAYRGKVLNIHPGPLPAYGGPGMYGEQVHASVLAAGERWSEVCILEVNDSYDQGRVVAREAVPVRPADTTAALQQRVLEVEHDLYWRVIQRYALGQA